MTGDITICNRALSYMGQRAISSLDEESAPAREIGLHYWPIVRKIIRLQDWACLNRRAPLALMHGERVEGWRYLYKLPADCKAILRVYEKGREKQPTGEYEPILSPQTNQRAIACDINGARIQYTSDGTDSSAYDDVLSDVIALGIADAACFKITGSKELAQTIFQRFQLWLDEAKFQNKQDVLEYAHSSNAYKKARGA